MNFKVGDKVQLVGQFWNEYCGIPLQNKVCEVFKVHSDGRTMVHLFPAGGGMWYSGWISDDSNHSHYAVAVSE